jgi:ketosteroid isomerase-like protein
MRKTTVLGMLAVVACGPKRNVDSPGSSTNATDVTAVTTSTDMTTRFALKAARFLAARDGKAIGALFADDASLSLIGESHDSHGRVGIEKRLAELFEADAHLSLSIGRVWVSTNVSVIEFEFRGLRSAGDVAGKRVAERRFGLVGACAVTFDAAGLVRSQRVYVDLATYLGQTDPQRLVAGSKVREVTTTSLAGSTVLESKGTSTEARNLEVANHFWASLEAHNVEKAMAPMADDYVYDDYAGPAALSREETTQLVARFLASLSEFKIAAKPVNFAAGDDVITETEEIAIFKAKPLDKRVTLHGITVMHFEDGKIAKQWQFANSHELLNQLRVMPSK